MAERLALPTSDHGVTGSNPAGGEILSEPKRRFIAQSLSCSPFHRLEMTEILLKGRKTLTHPSIHLILISKFDLIHNIIRFRIQASSLFLTIYSLKKKKKATKNVLCHMDKICDHFKIICTIALW